MSQTAGHSLREIAGTLDTFLHNYRQAAEERPGEPGDSQESVLFSAYDAVEVALGRLTEAAGDADEPPEHDPSGRKPLTPENMTADILPAADALERLLECGNTKDTHARDHLESALASLEDALKLLSDRTSPRDNPEPYTGNP